MVGIFISRRLRRAGPIPGRPFRAERICNLSWHFKIDLSAGIRIAPNALLERKCFVTAPASQQSPMALPSVTQNLLIDAAAIIPHPDAKAGGILGDSAFVGEASEPLAINRTLAVTRTAFDL